MEFTVFKSKYKHILEQGTELGERAVAEQLLTDGSHWVKYLTGNMRDSGRVEKLGGHYAVSMETPYVVKQYYTGEGHTEGRNAPASPWNPSKMWWHHAIDTYGKDYQKIMAKAVREAFGDGQ